VTDGVTSTEGDDGASRARTGRSLFGYLLYALLAYVPPLLTQPGKVVADTKTYLYLDPDRLLGRAVSMWDPNIGAGTVTHQNIGYLFPMGPWYWTFQHLGVPDWVAQRLWLGTLVFAAGTGVLYLCRTLALRGPGVIVAMLFYAFCPYSLHYASRLSVILLPWAGLGWALGFTIKALRDGGWRYPALFAIWVQIVGSVNATALIFAGVAPVAWIVYSVLIARDVHWRRAFGTTVKIGALSILASLWWIAGLSLQAGYGLDVLKYSETVKTVASTSASMEILRGLGYWFFYGRDRLGPWNDAVHNYTQRPVIIVISFAIVALALFAAAVVRWRHRSFFVLLALVGVIIGVGAHPYADPTPLGGVFKSFANSSSAGLALRSTGRAIPLVALSLAMLLGRGVDAAYASLSRARKPLLGLGIAVVVGALVLANFPSLYDGSYYTKGLERPEDIPSYWKDAAQWLDARPHDTRVLELPGSDFASYRWGDTVDPITPGLMDRPYIARELIPYGTPGTADLLIAFDRRIQEGVSDSDGWADVLRRLGVGDVVLRNDLENERYYLVSVKDLQGLFQPAPEGFTKGPTFGTEAAGEAPRRFIDELTLGAPANRPTPKPVEVYSVKHPTPIVHAESTHRTLVHDGDGEGYMDAAEIGLLRGAGTVVYAASLDGDAAELKSVLGTDGTVVVTDSNRKRARRWSMLRENVGYTEQRNEKPYAEDPSNAPLDVFPGASEDAYTVTDQRGVKRVVATAYGNPITYTPEDRPANAFDGDVRTAWKTQAFDEAIGQRIRLDTKAPITTDRVNVVQPQRGPTDRFITEVKLTFDGAHAVTERLGASSRTGAGETIVFPRRTFSSLEIEITDTNVGKRALNRGASAVGFAEVRVRDERTGTDTHVDEVVDMPTDALKALGSTSDAHPLVLIMSRERTLLVPPRLDPERNLVRQFVLPSERTFSLTGTARITTDAAQPEIDAAMGTPDAEHGGITSDASASLAACVRCRASAAVDGDPSTAWNTLFTTPQNSWAEYVLPKAVTFDHMNLQLVADGRHSVPTRIRLDADNGSRELTIPPVKDRKGENATVTVPLEFAPLTGRRIRVTIDDVRQVTTDNFTASQVVLPAGIAELGIPGAQLPAPAERLPRRCRTDLLTVDGTPFPVQISGATATAAAVGPLTIQPCDPRGGRATPTITLGPGPHVLRSVPGQTTAIQFDRLVLASAGGGAAPATGGGRVTGSPTPPPASPTVHVVSKGRTEMKVEVRDADQPFWLVLGESQSKGWQATVKGGGSLGESTLVDGFANGWRIDPKGRAVVAVTVVWTPQRRVWVSLGLSGVTVLAALAIILVSYVRRRARRRERDERPAPGEDDTRLLWPFTPLGERTPGWAYVVGPVLAGGVAALVVSPVVGLVTAVLVLLALRFPPARAVLTLAPPVLVGLLALYIAAKQQRYQLPPVFEWPTLFPRAETPGWLAIVLLSADAFVEFLRTPRRPLKDAPVGQPVNGASERDEDVDAAA
jgi:hypothetical protein